MLQFEYKTWTSQTKHTFFARLLWKHSLTVVHIAVVANFTFFQHMIHVLFLHSLTTRRVTVASKRVHRHVVVVVLENHFCPQKPFHSKIRCVWKQTNSLNGKKFTYSVFISGCLSSQLSLRLFYLPEKVGEMFEQSGTKSFLPTVTLTNRLPVRGGRCDGAQFVLMCEKAVVTFRVFWLPDNVLARSRVCQDPFKLSCAPRSYLCLFYFFQWVLTIQKLPTAQGLNKVVLRPSQGHYWI